MEVLETSNSCWKVVLDSFSNTQFNVRRGPLLLGTTSVGRRGHVGDPCANVGQEKELTGEARAASNHMRVKVAWKPEGLQITGTG